MSLTLWKAPFVDDADEAKALLDRWYDDGDHSLFEPSEDIGRFAEELRALYPDDPDTVFGDESKSPWADMPFDQSDRLIDLSIRWKADNAALDAIIELAAKHDLIVYDPQGPDVYRAREAPQPQPLEKPNAMDFVKVIVMVVPFAAATFAAWLIPWGWLRWPLVAVGSFFTIAALIVVYSTVAAAMGWLDEEPNAR